MFSFSFIALIALAVACFLLSFVTLWLAYQHDKVVELAGPLEEKKAVEARIAETRLILDDVNDELSKRRAVLDNIAIVQADCEALRQQRDDLQIEWAQMTERREEVAALRRETEDALTENLAVSAQLAEQRADLAEVRAKLEKAEDLVHKIDALTTEAQNLETRVEALRDTRRELEDAARKIEGLKLEAAAIEQQRADAEGKVTAKTSELNEVQERLVSTRTNLSADQSTLDTLKAELAAVREALRTAELNAQQARGLTEAELQSLEARKATLEREIEKAKGISAGGSGEVDEDPLRELKSAPAVLTAMSAWKKSHIEAEVDGLNRVEKRFKAFGLDYPNRILNAFHTAMKVNDTTQMTVLAGISGTGKSQLPRQYAAGMGIGFLQVPVQPRWDSPQDLMGFYNYIESRFRPTDLARAMYALDEQNNAEAIKDRMMMVLLDEMNLARVEYYFSDFLSRLESRPARGAENDSNLRKDAEIELEIPKALTRIFPGYNLLFAGTMNEDESTQSLSDKVVDRANVMRFGAPKKIANAKSAEGATETEALSRAVWEKWCGRNFAQDQEGLVDARVNEMLEIMQDFGKPFGHRLGRAIKGYTRAYPEVQDGKSRVETALADQIEMRLLPKLRGVDVEEKSQTFDKLEKMARDLRDEPLAEALRGSVEAAANASGQFVWKGVIR